MKEKYENSNGALQDWKITIEISRRDLKIVNWY